jgi:transposase
MEPGQTTPAAEQVRHRQGGPTADRCPARRQRVDVLHPHRLPVADVAQGLWPLADGPPLLSYLAPGGNIAEDSRCPPPEGTCPSGPKAQPLRGDHRQRVGEDRGKRGARGYDAGKKIKGRKRHIIVDTLGLLLAIAVHPANIQDRDGAKLVLAKLVGQFSRLKLIWADGGYAGKLIEWTQEVGHWILEIVKRSDDVTGFQILPKRWIVERTFAWFGRYRRLSKDYETLTESSEAIIYLAMIHLMLRRLKPCVV